MIPNLVAPIHAIITPLLTVLDPVGAIFGPRTVADTGTIADTGTVFDTGAILDAGAVLDTGPVTYTGPITDAATRALAGARQC
jgi:hypothetical protein